MNYPLRDKEYERLYGPIVHNTAFGASAIQGMRELGWGEVKPTPVKQLTSGDKRAYDRMRYLARRERENERQRMRRAE